MKIAVMAVLYLIVIPASVVIMAFFNKKILSYADRAPTGLVILFALVWPAGLPLFFIITTTMNIDNYSDKIGKLLDKFIRGE